jgi:23S rRNA (pseudouridine1915-N3)-methyltransferase
MRVHVIWPGKTKNPHVRALIDDYLKRISHFVRCDVTEIKADAGTAGQAGIDRESKRISDALLKDDIAVLLDPKGSEWTSEELAKQVEAWENNATKSVAFIVGGPDGVTEELHSRINRRWSLSRLTYTHETARVLLLEQLYRAYAIIHGLPYVK